MISGLGGAHDSRYTVHLRRVKKIIDSGLDRKFQFAVSRLIKMSGTVKAISHCLGHQADRGRLWDRVEISADDYIVVAYRRQPVYKRADHLAACGGVV